MKSIWNGAITFGLITIPVGLYSSVDERDFRFNQLHKKDNARIRYKKVCSECEEEVSTADIVKGYEFEKGNYVIFTEDDLGHLPADSIKAIDVVAFVPLEDIDPVYFQKAYYLAPEAAGIKAYKLLEKAMSEAGRVGVAKITIRDKEHLATLRVSKGVFVLETMHWPDEIRAPKFENLEKNPEIRDVELDMARDLVKNLSGPFEPEKFNDDYRARLEEAVKQKIDGQEIAVPPAKEPTQVLDLMEALRASVEATKKGASSKTKQKAATG